MAKSEYANYAEATNVVHKEEPHNIPSMHKGKVAAFVHVTTDNGTDVWFFADLPSDVAANFPNVGAANVEIITIGPKAG